jgi:hypothetical protein
MTITEEMWLNEKLNQKSSHRLGDHQNLSTVVKKFILIIVPFNIARPEDKENSLMQEK